MRKRYLVFGLSAVLAIAMAVPALGGPSNPVANISATAKKIAKKAKKAAKQAQLTADQAQSSANQAQNSADNAQTTADGATTAAAEALAAAQAAQTTADGKLGRDNFNNVTGPSTGSSTSDTKLFSFSCGGGNEATGGGYSVSGAGSDNVVPQISGPYGNGWLVQVSAIQGLTGQAWAASASGVCIQ